MGIYGQLFLLYKFGYMLYIFLNKLLTLIKERKEEVSTRKEIYVIWLGRVTVW